MTDDDRYRNFLFALFGATCIGYATSWPIGVGVWSLTVALDIMLVRYTRVLAERLKK